MVALGGSGTTGGVTADGLGLGLIACQPSGAQNSTNLANGQQVCSLATAQSSKQISTLGVFLAVAGITPGAGVNRIALYSEAGALLTNTADMTVSFESTGFREAACPAFVLIAGTNYYLSVLTSFTGTVPQINYDGTEAYPALNGHYINVFQNGQTTLPATITPSAMSLSFAANVIYAR